MPPKKKLPKSKSSKSQKWNEGAYCEFELNSNVKAYCRLLKFPLVEFFDFFSSPKQMVTQETLREKPILFTVWVSLYAVSKGHLKKIYSESLKPKSPPLFFKKDPISGKYSIFNASDSTEKEATLEECKHLERAAVWEPAHLKERLLAHKMGQPSETYEHLKAK